MTMTATRNSAPKKASPKDAKTQTQASARSRVAMPVDGAVELVAAEDMELEPTIRRSAYAGIVRTLLQADDEAVGYPFPVPEGRDLAKLKGYLSIAMRKSLQAVDPDAAARKRIVVRTVKGGKQLLVSFASLSDEQIQRRQELAAERARNPNAPRPGRPKTKSK